jgi:hypothetical protein
MEAFDKLHSILGSHKGSIDFALAEIGINSQELKSFRSEASQAIEWLGSRLDSHQDRINDLTVRMADLEPDPEVEPEPKPEPPTPEPEPELPPGPPLPLPRLKVSDFKLIGGIRLKEPFSPGGFAIDFEKGRIYQGGHAQKTDVIEYELPEIGLGEPGANHVNWPIATQIQRLPKFWSDQPWQGMAFEPIGLSVHDGKLWVSPRVFYNQGQGDQNRMWLISDHGDKIAIPVLERAKFGGGFVKGHSEWLIGNGGYRSGQGSCAGPTAAKIDGTVLLGQEPFGSMKFFARTPRPSGYWPATGTDTWVAMRPRDLEGNLLTREQSLAGEGIGAWCSDRITGGGIWTPRGVCYWGMLGFGVLDYKYQSEQFAEKGMNWPYLYTYDPDTFANDSVQFEEWPYGDIVGGEVGPDGRIYLMRRRAWKGGMYVEDCAIYVFELQGE